MLKKVTRVDLAEVPVGESLLGRDPLLMPSSPEGVMIVAECIAHLIGGDEICIGHGSRRDIMAGPRLVGHILIADVPANTGHSQRR